MTLIAGSHQWVTKHTELIVFLIDVCVCVCVHLHMRVYVCVLLWEELELWTLSYARQILHHDVITSVRLTFLIKVNRDSPATEE